MKINETFDLLRKKNEMALIVCLTAGFPTLEKSMEYLQLVSESGADMIEIGIPFSDPIADGPTIQYASHNALKNGVTLTSILEELKKIKLSVPLILMSYFNPLLAYGNMKLSNDLEEAGINGIIVPDLPVEETSEWISHSGISIIFLVAPTSTESRIRLVAEKSDSFLYCVSIAGTTGTREKLSPDLIPFVKKIKKITDKPVAVGFGISTPQHISALRRQAEGVIVGSRVIEAVKRGEDLAALVEQLKAATKEN
ncbi:MAG: tryptophan synthase subunit alpha [Candidatus Neomarinimicrobiota bacterium]|nr:MAG: tryptophan synthase subunit alpha [Candidatus Neomarinimicrobiota bacterium]